MCNGSGHCWTLSQCLFWSCSSCHLAVVVEKLSSASLWGELWGGAPFRWNKPCNSSSCSLCCSRIPAGVLSQSDAFSWWGSWTGSLHKVDKASLVADFSQYSCLLNTTMSRAQKAFVLEVPLKWSQFLFCSGLACENKGRALKYSVFSETGPIDELITADTTEA